MNLEPGYILNATFRIERLLGRGAMGCVYAAYDQKLDRMVAIKVLTSVGEGEGEGEGDGDDRERFAVEAKALSDIKHKGICAVYKLGALPNNTPYLVMEYVEGVTLRSRLLSLGTMPWRDAAKLIIDLCEALVSVHSAGIVHRDIKPDNIMLSAEGPKLLDFGLCRLPNQNLTQPGLLVGTVMYVSPEQCSGLAATAHSDIYSLGCVLFELLTGQTPFEADNPVAMVHQHAFADPPKLSTFGRCSPDLEETVQRCLEKNPHDRHTDVTALAKELSRLVAKSDEAFIPHNQKRPTAIKRTSRRPAELIAASCVIMGLAACLAFTPATCFLLSRYPTPSMQSIALHGAEMMRSLHNYGDSHLLASAVATSLNHQPRHAEQAASRMQLRRSLAELNQDVKQHLPSQFDQRLIHDCLLDLRVVAEYKPDILIAWKEKDFDNYEKLVALANTGDEPTLQNNLYRMRDISKLVWTRCVNSCGMRKNPSGLHRANFRAFDQLSAKVKPYRSEKLQLGLLEMRWHLMMFSGDYPGTLQSGMEFINANPHRMEKQTVLFALIEEHEHVGRYKQALLTARRVMEMNCDLPDSIFLRSAAALKCAEMAHVLGDDKASVKYLHTAEDWSKSIDIPKDKIEFQGRRQNALNAISAPKRLTN